MATKSPSPPLQPCDQLIVYEATQRHTHSLVIVDLCSQKARFLTDDEGHDEFPKWSPDGKYLAFLSDRGNRSEDYRDLWLIETATGELVQLTFDASIWSSELSFVWSPDGSEILYTGKQDEKNMTQIVNLEDGSIRFLPGVWGPFSWSQIGNKIALVTAVEPVDKPSEGYEDSTIVPGQLVVVRPDGDRLAGGSQDSLYPLHSSSEWLWSPDSEHLAVAFYASLRGGGGDIELVAVQERKLVTVKRLQDLIPSVENKAIQSLSWSPTGQEIAFVVVDFSSRHSRPYWGQVLVVDRDFASFRALTPEGMFCDDVQWSPDGSQLAFVCDRGNPPYARIRVVNADGSSLHAITETAEDARNPQWQPLPQP